MALATLDDVRAGIWTIRCLTRCRLLLKRRGVDAMTLPPSGRIPVTGQRAVARLLREREDKCLSNALIAQAWRADHGDPVDVLIGVASPESGFSAHAWLSDADPSAAAGHEPIHRVPPKVGHPTTRE